MKTAEQPGEHVVRSLVLKTGNVANITPPAVNDIDSGIHLFSSFRRTIKKKLYFIIFNVLFFL